MLFCLSVPRGLHQCPLWVKYAPTVWHCADRTNSQWAGFKVLLLVYLTQFIKVKLAAQNITVKKAGVV